MVSSLLSCLRRVYFDLILSQDDLSTGPFLFLFISVCLSVFILFFHLPFLHFSLFFQLSAVNQAMLSNNYGRVQFSDRIPFSTPVVRMWPVRIHVNIYVSFTCSLVKFQVTVRKMDRYSYDHSNDWCRLTLEHLLQRLVISSDCNQTCLQRIDEIFLHLLYIARDLLDRKWKQ